MNIPRLLIAAIILNSLPLAYGEEVTIEMGPDTKDVWFSSMYHRIQGINNHELKTGGWGDSYRFLIQPNLSQLPKKADTAILWLYCFDVKDATTTVGMNVYRVTSPWNEYTGWDNMPSALSLGSLPAPNGSAWFGINITQWYNGWQFGTYPNYGFMFGPRGNNNQFNNFYSSDYWVSGFRPRLQVKYTSDKQFKMPLPSGKTWLLTTEISGCDCATSSIDVNHTGLNYYSLDFSAKTLENNGNSEFNVNVLAAAKGKVITASYNDANGYYVVIDHDEDGNINTGFSTRYLHLASLPYVKAGETVEIGKVLGIMGNTGLSEGIHLHFGVRFNNSGRSDVPELSSIKIDGRFLSEYMTDCNGTIRNSDSYYYSTNLQK